VNFVLRGEVKMVTVIRRVTAVLPVHELGCSY